VHGRESRQRIKDSLNIFLEINVLSNAMEAAFVYMISYIAER
jgi:hypothetical protein